MDSHLALSLLISLAISAVGVFTSIVVAKKLGIIDAPNIRSSHEKPTPRGGGLGIVTGISIVAIIGFAVNIDIPPWSFWLGLGIVFCIGFLDDVRAGINITARFTAQIAASVIVIAFLGRMNAFPLPGPFDFSLNWAAYPISALWIIAVINFYNFMDGIDGIAGTQAVISGFVLLLVAGGEASWLGAVIIGSSIGFLLFNWQPAKIFLGDTGSYSLGYCLAVAPFLGGSDGASQLVMLMGLSMWLFLADPTIVLFLRSLNREQVWEAHRNHYYQRLTKTGFGHSQVTLLVGLGSALISTIAVVAFRVDTASFWWAAFIFAAIIFLGEILLVRSRERRVAERPSNRCERNP